MTFPSERRARAPAIALTSMLDVIFLLLCFFVTVSVFSQWESEISIQLPNAKTAEAPLDLGDGSKLTLAGIDFDAGASLLVSDNLGRDATLRIEGLTSAQRLRIRCGADRLRVREDANGNLRPYTAGAYIVFR